MTTVISMFYGKEDLTFLVFKSTNNKKFKVTPICQNICYLSIESSATRLNIESPSEFCILITQS